jgi:carbonic anhydrase/acetyltransferase-like protein (isoleucine patch superfamily)
MEAEAIADYVQVQGDEFSLTVGQQINILDNSVCKHALEHSVI